MESSLARNMEDEMDLGFRVEDLGFGLWGFRV